ncbi:hypothetical protein [Pseudoprimorskyibacter insulae]|uniref:Transferrin-binding protein B C-lobe/N-lobe beta barrel domain-containing protein n=1 Tax=Pseudoprimorskyibacter insulae TaxID=1695997 RepID=A0A2R8APT7_9RHOB|nr:hypothetical protein [Pseudoprimorskyibacter insulae]SPF78061.1 hypothetical protein PRI8871_00650 [Pseudoprimorskyibacter insulae]
MTRTLAFFAALGVLTACSGGNPLKTAETATTTTTGSTTTNSPITTTRNLPSGTTNASANSAIVRYETQTEDSTGGYAMNIAYNNDQGQDEFNVDNLPFDGDNSYVRGNTAGAQNTIGQIGSFAVYEADNTTVDPVTGTTINTFTYRAIYGRSTSGASEFAIIRSGSYAGYGFGGFIYQRNEFDDAGNTVRLVMPTEGDAIYRGDYSGIRVYDGVSGLHYVDGDAEMLIDFKDFNDDQQGVALFISNRRLLDINGNDVTANYYSAIDAAGSAAAVRRTDGSGNLVLPTVTPVVTPGVADDNGELLQGLGSLLAFTDGTIATEGEGTYYAIMSGDNAEEIVGIAVTEGDNYWVDGTTYQETGGFIVYRQ